MAIWISLAALVISALSFGHTWLLRREDRKIRVAQRAAEIDALTSESHLITQQIVFKLGETRVFLLSDPDPKAVEAGYGEMVAKLAKLSESAVELRIDLNEMREQAVAAREQQDVVQLEEIAGRAREYKVSILNHFQAAEQMFTTISGSYEWPTHRLRKDEPSST